MDNRAIPFEKATVIPFQKGTTDTANKSPENAPVKRTPVTRRRVPTGNAVPVLPPTTDSLPFTQLASQVRGWIQDGKFRRLSTQTLKSRELVLRLFSTWCEGEKIVNIDRIVLKRFFTYMAVAHETGNRWNKTGPREVVFQRELRPETTATYFRILRTFFRYLVKEQVLTTSPMETIDPPKVPRDQIQPLTADQQQMLLAATRQSRHKLRDEALVLLLLDTGIRACEVVSLTMADINLAEGYGIIREGKGGKKRRVMFSPATRRALSNYVRLHGRSEGDPVFIAEGGHQLGMGLTRSGLAQLIERLSKSAGISDIRCSPHTLRHTFAVEFVRGGGNLYSLMEILGHTSLTISKRYVSLAEADIAAQHRQHSPVERLLGKGGNK